MIRSLTLPKPFKRDISVSEQDNAQAQNAVFRLGPSYAQKRGMKVAAKQDRKALDYFTSTIIPVHCSLQAVAVLTLKHAVVLIGFAVGMMALVRQILAD
jgi:hypothetical protein